MHKHLGAPLRAAAWALAAAGLLSACGGSDHMLIRVSNI